MWRSVEVCFASDHPVARGHFPSNPIIPGALLLDEVVRVVAEAAGHDGEIMIRVAKFFRPVRPGDPLLLRWQRFGGAQIGFECRMIGGHVLAASGTLEIGPGRQ